MPRKTWMPSPMPARTMAGASARPAIRARRLILAADVELSGEESVDIALAEQARIAR